MQSFTWGSDEGMKALIAMQHKDFFDLDVESWEFSPSPSEFKTLVNSLVLASEADTDLGEAAADLLSSIAESLGVEFI